MLSHNQELELCQYMKEYENYSFPQIVANFLAPLNLGNGWSHTAQIDMLYIICYH